LRKKDLRGILKKFRRCFRCGKSLRILKKLKKFTVFNLKPVIYNCFEQDVHFCAAISVSMEAEATSSAIAAQALCPLTAGVNGRQGHGGSYGGQGQSSPLQSEDGGHLHCGCRWSPSTSRSTMVDIESLVASMYQNTALPWQTGMSCFLAIPLHRNQFIEIN